MRIITLFKQLLLLALVFVAGNAMAQTVLLEEDFSKCTSTSPDNPGASAAAIDEYTSEPGWAVENAYVGEGNLKFGTSSKLGCITTPALDLSDETATYTLSFKACAWSGDKTSLKVSVDDQEAVEVAGLSNAGAPYAANMKDFSLEVKGTAASKIKIAGFQASKGRFFLDDVKVTKKAEGEVADPSLKAPSLVSFGAVKIGTTSTKGIEISGADLTADLTVAISGEGFSCETTTISKDEAANVVLNVALTPAAETEYSGELTISGGGLAEDVVISLVGSGVELEGFGTAEAPFTVADVIKLNNPNENYWVKGVIVGLVNGQSLETNAIFDLSGAATVVATNILLADEAGVKDVTLCIPVQLPSGDIRTALNLSDNPTNLGREVSICGSLTAYFGVPGLKTPTEYVMSEDGDSPSLVAPSSVSFGAVKVGATLTKDIEIFGANLTEDLTVAISGEGFSCETTTISKDEAASVVLSVAFTPADETEYSGELTISGGGLAEDVVISLVGSGIELEGAGTAEAPFTVADVIKQNNPGGNYWVKGVIVGFVNGQSIETGAVFDLSGETIVATNILLADDADVKDVTLCIPVQLPAGDIRTALNLSDNPTNLGSEVSIYGSLAAYYGVPGLKTPTDYVLSEGGGSAIADVEAAAGNAPIEVYTLGGVKVGNSLSGLAKGVYVVKQGNQVKKVTK